MILIILRKRGEFAPRFFFHQDCDVLRSVTFPRTKSVQLILEIPTSLRAPNSMTAIIDSVHATGQGRDSSCRSPHYNPSHAVADVILSGTTVNRIS